MDRDSIIDGLRMTMDLCVFDPSTGEEIEPHLLNDISRATYDACKGALEILERRCVNCGRTVNNGGWYEDGRTRCPIEEHYALPKDGYCHLWEKRKVWEDDYVKRAEEGENR